MFEIKQEDIDNGRRCHGEHCPAAIALRRALKAEQVTTLTGHSQVWFDDRVEYYNHSPKLWQFIFDFDKGNVVRPGMYAIFLEEVEPYAHASGDA